MLWPIPPFRLPGFLEKPFDSVPEHWFSYTLLLIDYSQRARKNRVKKSQSGIDSHSKQEIYFFVSPFI
jgi:hypothetical protein